MTATLTTVNGILKEVYEGDINDQLESEKILMKRIEQSSDGVFENAGGKYVVFPLRTGRNHGISYRAENVQLANAGRQKYAQAQETLRYGYGRSYLTGQVIELARTNMQAFANAADREMTGLKDDLSRDENRISWGHYQANTVGATGILSRCTAAVTGQTLTAPTTGVIEVGMIVDFVDNTGVAVTGGTARTVIASTPYSTSFTVDAAGGNVTTVIGTNVVRTGNWNQEPYGVLGLVDNVGTYHNINSATAGNEYWKSYVDSTTTTLTEAPMIAACDQIRRNSGKRPSVVFASLGCRRAYFNLCVQLRRYNEPKEFSGGLIGLAFNYEKELPVVTDVMCPSSTMLFLTESEITKYRTKPWYFADDDGSVLKYVHNYDAWEALMKQYWQLVTHQRNAHAKLTTVTEA